MNTDVWKRSGHLEHYKENMYFVDSEEAEFGIKPMNCPGAAMVYESSLRSYRELPLRLSEFGHCHRYERSGVLSGLTRVRSFVQDDAHIYCALEQLEAEVVDLIELVRRGLRRLRIRGLPRRALHPAGELHRHRRPVGRGRSGAHGRARAHRVPPQAEPRRRGLLRAEDRLPRTGRPGPLAPVRHHPGRLLSGGALRPLLRGRGRHAQAPGASSTGPSSARSSGSWRCSSSTPLERFPCGSLPFRRSCFPSARSSTTTLEASTEELRAAGVRASLDDRATRRSGYKIREAQLQKVPFMLVVGDQEKEAGTVVGAQSQRRRRRAGRPRGLRRAFATASSRKRPSHREGLGWRWKNESNGKHNGGSRYREEHATDSPGGVLSIGRFVSTSASVQERFV